MKAASLYSSQTREDGELCCGLSQETRYQIPHRIAPTGIHVDSCYMDSGVVGGGKCLCLVFIPSL